MNILALEPYYGGSHKAFLDGWIERSRHHWTLLTLSPRKWKWRMRHAAVTFTERVTERLAATESWDALFCSDMLNLAEFLGLAPDPIRSLPSVVYFHENQLTYPFRCQTERDYHFGFTNMTTALAATAVWFNSAFHRDDFLGALADVLKRMPDYQPLDTPQQIRAKSSIHPPGITEFPPRDPRPPGPLRILWAARWEHDKDPDTFFDAVRQLARDGTDFRLSVIGEQFKDSPPVFDEARESLANYIDRWGFLPTRPDYVAALSETDVAVSTATHEFFGISMAEALAAGCYPLVPRRLAYPELLGLNEDPAAEAFFYDGSAKALRRRLTDLSQRAAHGSLWHTDRDWGVRRAARFAWTQLAPEMDAAIEALTPRGSLPTNRA